MQPVALDIKSALAGRPRLERRGAHTSDAEVEAAFVTLSPFRDGGIFAGSFQGDSGWERHTAGDEIVQILDGETRLTICTGAGREVFELTAGMLIVVPKGCWHRFHSDSGVTVMTATPQPTEHTFDDDPPADP